MHTHRYGTSATLDLTFGTNRFFVVVGVRHEMLKHTSFASVMLSSARGCEKRDHTLTIQEGMCLSCCRLHSGRLS
jgi:hypothetical protein